MDAPDPRRAQLVKILEEIKPGIASDPCALNASLEQLQPAERIGAVPRRAELERLADTLEEKITPATWIAVAMTAFERGYYLPSSLYTMVQIVLAAEEQARRKSPAGAGRRQQLAGACAALYFDLTREVPSIVNARSRGAANRYLALVEAAFARAGLPGWRWNAENTAREWSAALRQYKEKAEK